MERYGYVRATDITGAVALLNEPGIRSLPLAGGTDLLLLLKSNPSLCDRVVDISQVSELHSITEVDDRIIIGACATFSEILESPIIRRSASLLAQACRLIGAVQIRNMGTLGGNVANAAACADSLPALVCLDAVATVSTPHARLEWPVSELVQAPNRTLIPPGGLLEHLSFLAPPPGSRSVFLKLGRREALAISRLTVAALGRQDEDGRIVEARLAPGSAAPQVVRYTAVEAMLAGQFPGPALFQDAAHLTAREMIRMAGKRWSSEFKEPALTAMVRRALSQVFVSDIHLPGNNT